MTLFAGALLRTIEFVMVTTDASFPGPGELGGSRELGSGAADARQGEGYLRRGTVRRGSGTRGTLCALKAAEDRPAARPHWTEVLGWTVHTALALDHSAQLEWKFANSLLACWTD